MNALQNIVNFQLHPINDLNTYAKNCRRELQENAVLVLKNFLAKEPLSELQREAQKLHSKAFYCSQNHNVFLTKKNFQLNAKHPCNIDVTSNKGCVPHDLIPLDSNLRSIYNSAIFQNFVQSLMLVDKIHPYSDELSSINYNYYKKNQHLGWHFDNASFAISLMVQSSTSGGKFQYVADARNVEGNSINIQLIDSVLKNKHPVQELQVEEGTLVFFNGSNFLHRVAPVTSNKHRVLATLNYNLEKNVKLSEKARLTFFGRVK
jgi:hypothetical protein